MSIDKFPDLPPDLRDVADPHRDADVVQVGGVANGYDGFGICPECGKRTYLPIPGVECVPCMVAR